MVAQKYRRDIVRFDTMFVAQKYEQMNIFEKNFTISA